LEAIKASQENQEKETEYNNNKETQVQDNNRQLQDFVEDDQNSPTIQENIFFNKIKEGEKSSIFLLLGYHHKINSVVNLEDYDTER